MFVSKDDHEEETINYYNSKHRNTFEKDDILVRLTKAEYFIRNTIDDDQVQTDDEENFTDLRSCVAPTDTDSGKDKLSKLFQIVFCMN